jgi:hypothetical protein
MKTVYVPESDYVKIVHGFQKTTGINGLALILEFLIGQGWVEGLIKPVLYELNIDQEKFFKVFWREIEKQANK